MKRFGKWFGSSMLVIASIFMLASIVSCGDKKKQTGGKGEKDGKEMFDITFGVAPSEAGSITAKVDGKDITSPAKVEKDKEIVFTLEIKDKTKYAVDKWVGAKEESDKMTAKLKVAGKVDVKAILKEIKKDPEKDPEKDPKPTHKVTFKVVDEKGTEVDATKASIKATKKAKDATSESDLNSGEAVAKDTYLTFTLTISDKSSYEFVDWDGADKDASNNLKATKKMADADITVTAKVKMISKVEVEITEIKFGDVYTLAKNDLDDALKEDGFYYEFPASYNTIKITEKHTPADAMVTQNPSGDVMLTEVDQTVTLTVTKGESSKKYTLKLKKAKAGESKELKWIKVDGDVLEASEIDAAKTSDGAEVIIDQGKSPVITWESEDGATVTVATKKNSDLKYGVEKDCTQDKSFTVTMPTNDKELPYFVKITSTKNGASQVYILKLLYEKESNEDDPNAPQEELAITEIKLGDVYQLKERDIAQAMENYGFSYELPVTTNKIKITTKYKPKTATLTQTPEGEITITEQDQRVVLKLKNEKGEKTYTLILKKTKASASKELSWLKVDDNTLKAESLEIAKGTGYLIRREAGTKQVVFTWDAVEGTKVTVQKKEGKNGAYGAKEDKTTEKSYTLPLDASPKEYELKIECVKGTETTTYTLKIEVYKKSSNDDDD